MRNVLKESGICIGVKTIWVEMIKNYLSKYIRVQNSENGAFAIIMVKKMNTIRRGK